MFAGYDGETSLFAGLAVKLRVKNDFFMDRF